VKRSIVSVGRVLFELIDHRGTRGGEPDERASTCLVGCLIAGVEEDIAQFKSALCAV